MAYVPPKIRELQAAYVQIGTLADQVYVELRDKEQNIFAVFKKNSGEIYEEFELEDYKKLVEQNKPE